MQRSALGVFVLLVLVAGASVAAIWYLRGGGAMLQPDATGPAATVMARPEAGEVAAVEGALDTEAAAEQRQAVAAGEAGEASGPAIVGRVVGEDRQPIEGAEVQCRPGANFLDMENFDVFDAEAVADVGDVEGWAERLREQAKLRTVARTDADGRFAVRARGEGRSVSLRVSAPGLRVLERNAVRPTASETDLGELVLQTGAIVSGRVVDAHGAPVEGARVRRMQEFEMTAGMDFDFAVPGAEVFENVGGGDSAVSDAAGRFELAHCEAGEFALQARHPDRPSARSDKLTVAKGQTLHGIVLAMQAGATITGVVRGVPEGVQNVRVMASARRAPAAGGEGAATVFNLIGDPGELLGDIGMPFGERHATLGKDGTFEFRGLQMGTTYSVWAVQQGRGFRGGACTQRLEVASGTSGVELRYEAGVNVTFTVLAAGSGQPVEQLWVRDRLRGGENAGIEFGDFTWGGGSGGRSAKYPDGKVTIANLRPKKNQTLQLNLEAVGFEAFERKDIVLPTSGTLDLGTVRLAAHPVVVVTVLDSDGGRPIAKARVSLQEQEPREANPFGMSRRMGRGGPASAQTDEAGRCTVNAPAGAAKLDVTARGFAPGAAELPASAEAVREQTVRLSVGGTVEVTVLAADGQPLAGASVEGRDADGERSRQRTDAKGIARFAHQTPGRHEFRLAEQRGDVAWMREAISVRVNGGQPPADDAAWTAVDVVDRATATLTLEKAAAARLRGVVRENGVPLAGASVAFREGASAAGAGSDVEAMMGGMLERMGQRGRSQVRTGDDGSFELTDLPAGAHHLRITHKDRAMSTDVAVTLVIGDNRSDVELDMTSLRGVVLDPDGRPVDGARVRVAVARERSGADVAGMMEGMLPGMGLGGSSLRTDASGAFELRGVQPGVELTVSASARGFAPASVSAKATLGQTISGLQVQLLAAGKVEVTVAGAGPFAAVQARYVGDDETVPPVVQMLRRGKGTLTGLRPGTWELEFQGMPNGEQGEPRKKTVEVRAGETVTVEL